MVLTMVLNFKQGKLDLHFADEKYRCESNSIISISFNGCKITKALMNNVFTSAIFKNLRESTNFNLTCPYYAGYMEIKNYRLAIPKYLPLPNIGRYCAEVAVQGKPQGSKKLMMMSTFIGKGTYEFKI